MAQLEKVINKFLDGYVGDGINVKKGPATPMYDIPNSKWVLNKNIYFIYSDKGILILSFQYNPNKDSYLIFRGLKLCNMLCRFFSVCDDDAMRYVRGWFADKYGLSKLSDLKKFIPDPVNT